MPVVNQITLKQNAITPVLFNMIISQRVFDSGVASTELADSFRVDGTLYGDTKIYHSFDIGSPEEWLDDTEAPDLLKLNRNKSGKTQIITMGVYKMIYITTDQYLSKQAFMGNSTFAEYTSFLTGSLRKIKRVYDRALINNKIGTATPVTPKCDITVTTPEGATLEETHRLEAQTLAAELVVLRAELEDNSRDYNQYGYLRSYSPDDFVAVWNVKQHAKLTKVDIPTIFHKDINEKGGFREYDMPEKWFGVQATANYTLKTSASAVEDNKRVAVSAWYNVSGATATIQNKPDNNSVFLWAGDLLPYTGQQIRDHARGITVTVASTTWLADNYYTVDGTIAFMLVHKGALPFMSGFETQTQFWNARSLTSTNFLIFGHNNLEFLAEYPLIRVRLVNA